MAAEQTKVVDTPDGTAVGATTKAASTWSANGSTLAGATGFIITYVLTATGLEDDPEQAVAVGGALSLILIWAGGKLAGLKGGARTPTDQAQTVERVTVQQVDATDPELKQAIIAVASSAGLIPGQEPPQGTGEHRAATTPTTLTEAPTGSTAALAATDAPTGTPGTLDPIVEPGHIEVAEDPARDA